MENGRSFRKGRPLPSEGRTRTSRRKIQWTDRAHPTVGRPEEDSWSRCIAAKDVATCT